MARSPQEERIGLGLGAHGVVRGFAQALHLRLRRLQNEVENLSSGSRKLRSL